MKGGRVGVCAGAGRGKAEVWPFTTTAVAEEASETVVPEMIIAGPLGESVCVPITYAEAGSAVMVDKP